MSLGGDAECDCAGFGTAGFATGGAGLAAGGGGCGWGQTWALAYFSPSVSVGSTNLIADTDEANNKQIIEYFIFI